MPSLAELLDTSAQWGRGVQNKISDLVSPEAWAQALRNPPRVLSQYQQMQPGQQQQTISEAFDNALNFGPAMLGKIVYHGSPHKFDAFDASKIGTGEGAQAYGHGLYFAENPSVATQYRDALSAGELRLGDGSKYDPNNIKHFAAVTLKDYKTPADAIKNINAEINQLSQINASWRDSAIAQKKALINEISKGDLPTVKEISHGSVYKVDLPDEHIAKMLDWDKPLSQQSKEVRGVLQSMMTKARKSFPQIDANGDPIAGQIHHLYAQHRGGNAQVVADELKAAGIPGIRYLDQGSRAGGQGTSNYVVFPGNEKLTKILERN
tara:strand:- start:110 stop:1075 length:966 start_codon:yes stop_codon:yes gene_type:complete